MSPIRLLVLAASADVRVIKAALADSKDRFIVESASQCQVGIERLAASGQGTISAVVADLFLPDSGGIETLETLLHVAPRVPVLVLSRGSEEPVAITAVQRGAQDYLLREHLDPYSLRKALNGMLERAAHVESLLRESEQALVTLNSIGDAVVSTDVAGNVTYLNAVAEEMTGWSGSEATGRPLRDVVRIIDAESRESALDPLEMAMRQDTTVGLPANSLLVRRDGHESAIEDTAAPIHDRHGQVAGAVIVFHDVGAARAMSLRMSELAQHDVLTGLPNRLLLNDRLACAVTTSCRQFRSFAVLFLDLDGFKLINDTRGHAAGDGVLQSVAKRLVAGVRKSDTVSRQGGDEFVILLSEVSCPKDAASTADKLLAAIARPHRIDGEDLHVTASVGVAVYPGDGADAETLVKNADLALLRAKAGNCGKPFLAATATSASQRASKKVRRVKQARGNNRFPELVQAGF